MPPSPVNLFGIGSLLNIIHHLVRRNFLLSRLRDHAEAAVGPVLLVLDFGLDQPPLQGSTFTVFLTENDRPYLLLKVI